MSERRRYRAILGQHKDPVIASFIKTEAGADRYAYTHAYSSAQARRNIVARLGRDVPSSESKKRVQRPLMSLWRSQYRWKDKTGNYIEYKRQLAMDMIEVYNSVRRTRETVKIKRRA